MEKLTSTSCNQNTSALAEHSSAALGKQDYVSSPPTPLQNDHHYYHQDIANDFCSMYNSIIQSNSSLPLSLSLTPSSCSSFEDLHLNFDLTSDAIATEHRLNQARLILEYQQLCDHYDLCFARLQILIAEIETLRRENNHLRLVNTDLIKFLSLSSSQAAMDKALQNEEEVSDLNMKRCERRNGNDHWNSLPKSVSVRSGSYLKLKQLQGSGNNQQRVVKPSVRVYVPSGAAKQKAMELEAYDQGMLKTELCNKWQESGACPYGNHCQFAHGVNELRPVIRHPRYKTEVCRMVLVGQTCPYGHRCHFRHSLTDQERYLINPR